jgi:hypothetical protein
LNLSGHWPVVSIRPPPKEMPGRPTEIYESSVRPVE